MRKIFWGFMLVGVLISSGSLMGQEQQIPADMDLLFRRVQILGSGGESHYGLLAGVTDRGLVLRIDGKDTVVPYHKMERVVIAHPKKTTSLALSSMFVSSYVVNLILFKAEGQPTAYVQTGITPFCLILGNGITVAAAGGLGLLLGSTLLKGERAFEFDGDENEKLEEWNRLQRFATGRDGPPPKFHLTVQGGQVFNMASEAYRSLLKNKGYRVRKEFYSESGYAEGASDFNFFRKVQLSYSLTSFAEVGLAMYFCGEPSLWGYRWDPEPYAGIIHSFDARGYYAVAAFHPFSAKTARSYDWNLGIGVGVADVDLKLSATLNRWYLGSTISADHHLSKTLVSGVVFTELKLYLQKNFSVGVAADYVYIPRETMPEVSEVGIPAQRLDLGNGSIGFTLGLHL